MKASKRNLENQARKAEKLANGKPLISRYERKSITEEQYQELLKKQTGLGKGVVSHKG